MDGHSSYEDPNGLHALPINPNNDLDSTYSYNDVSFSLTQEPGRGWRLVDQTNGVEVLNGAAVSGLFPTKAAGFWYSVQYAASAKR